MTAGSNGNGGGAPENDDPFGYLYRQDGEQGPADPQGGAPPQPSPGTAGVPRTSYHQVTRVGQTTYGGQRTATGGYPGQAGVPRQPGHPAPGHPPPADPEPRTPSHGGGHGGHGGHGGGRPANRGLLIGAIAVVAAVAIGIGAAIGIGGDSDDGANPEPTTSTSTKPKPSKSAKEEPKPDELPPVVDAITLNPSGGAHAATEHEGALGEDGSYIAGMEAVGASVTWTFKAPEEKQYRLNVRYGVPGKDAKATMVINGEAKSIDLKNWAKQKEWSWTRSYVLTNLKKGDNSITLTCGQGDTCTFALDQLALTEDGYPPEWP